MANSEPPTESLAVDLARECLYRFLAAALSDPMTDRWSILNDGDTQCVAREAAEVLRSDFIAATAPLGFGELPVERLDLDPMLEELRRPQDQVISEYERVFGLVHARECPPYETEYHHTSDAAFRAQQLADVAGFYRAFGLETAQAAPDRPDAIALELEFMAFLLTKKRLAANDEQADVCDKALRDFFRDHVLWWMPSFSAGLWRKAGDGFYAVVAQALAAFLRTERERFQLPPPRLPLQPAPIERPEEQPECLGCSAIEISPQSL